MNSKVNWFFEQDSAWHDAYALLRDIVLDCGLTEELKWGCPCYTVDGRNVVLIHGFKQYCALLFHKGALLDDPAGILVQQTENVQSARQVRFTSAREVATLERTLKIYVRAAVDVETSGKKVAMKQTAAFAVPDEFAARMKASPALKKAFDALTPGRQRAYLLHFASATQSATRAARVARNEARILAGKGLHD